MYVQVMEPKHQKQRGPGNRQQSQAVIRIVWLMQTYGSG